MEGVVIAAAARTPVGSFGGAFKTVSAVDLGVTAGRALFDRSGISPELVDEVVIGCVLDAGLGQNVARQVAIRAGCPETVPAMTINKVCGSGLRAVSLAAQMIRAGDAHVVLAGGTENMSRAPFLVRDARWGARLGSRELTDSMIADGLWDAFADYHMGVTAENVAERWKVTRKEQDSFAALSQEKAAWARSQGRFAEEIAPVEVATEKGAPVRVEADEHPRPETTVETLAALKPAFTPEGTVTAGNASGINDGAAALLVMSESRASELGISPPARIASYASTANAPDVMGVSPIDAIAAAADRAGVAIDAIDLFEVNEAFAAQAIVVARESGIPAEKLNVNGGAIALGHPIGASGARIAVTLLYEMQRRGANTGMAALCIGGGQADAVLFRR